MMVQLDNELEYKLQDEIEYDMNKSTVHFRPMGHPQSKTLSQAQMDNDASTTQNTSYYNIPQWNMGQFKENKPFIKTSENWNLDLNKTKPTKYAYPHQNPK